MKLLKSIVAAGIISCASVSAFAQGAYVKLGGGYNLGIASTSAQNYKANYTQDHQTGAKIGGNEEAELVKINYGKGLTGIASLGYMFNKNLGTELDISFLHGGKNKISTISISNGRSFSEQILKYSSSAKMIYFQPSVIFLTDLNGLFSAYGKFGVIVAKGIIYENNYSLYHDSEIGSEEFTAEKQYWGGWEFGLMAVLGLEYKLNTKFSLYSEVKINSLSYAPNRYKVDNVTVNGESTGNPNPVDLVKKYSITFPHQYSAEIKQAFPLSSAGLNIGLKYNF